ncbi:hypothetical protein ACHAQJ_001389 [Trichoderma viride]
MSYDGKPDAMFNSGDDPLPLASNLFTEPGLGRGYSVPFGNSRSDVSDNGHFEGATAQSEVDFTFEGDATQGQTRRARVAHLPQPACAAIEEHLPPLFLDSTEQDVAEELLTPDTFDWWKTRDVMASKGLLPTIPQIYYCGVQGGRPNTSLATNKAKLEWEDLSLGVRWLILLRLSEKQSFGIVVITQLKLLKSQVHDFVTTYINYCDQWNAFEQTVFQRSLALKGYSEARDRLLVSWVHEKRPQLPIDRITNEDVQMGLRFLSERGVVHHNINFQEWVNQKDTKDFAHLKIDGPIMRDCMDHRLLRRAAAAKLLPIQDIEEKVRQHGRDNHGNEHNAHIRNVMANDAFLGMLHGIVPFEDDFWYNDVELSAEAQAVLDTISADLRIGEPMPMPIPPYQRQQKREEAGRALRHTVPELQPQYVLGSLVKTQWEVDNGYPMGYLTDCAPSDLTDYTAEMQYIPEEQTKMITSRGPAAPQNIAEQQVSQASSSSAVQTSNRSAGQQSHHQSERYEKSSSIYSGVAKYHSPAAYAAALAGGRNASRPRIGAARARFMTSNDKGQLMVGMAADLSSVAAQAPQNPGFTRQLAEEGCPGQPEVSRRAVEAEPANLPDLRPAEDFEPNNSILASERSKRTRRPSARALESLQYALEMAQSTETIPEKPRGKKAQPSRSKRKQEDQGEDEDQDEGDDENTHSRFGSTQEAWTEAQAAAEVVGFPTPTGSDLVHLNNSTLPAWPGLIDESPGPGVDSNRRLAVEEPGQSGSETSTTLGTQQRPARKRQNRRSDKIFGMFKTQELNACPPPVSATHCAWSADVAEFAVEAVRAYYAVRADRVNSYSQIPRNLQIDREVIQATLTSMEAEFTRTEFQLRGENGPTAERAEFAGVTDSATFAIHATEACFALEEVQVISELRQVQESDNAIQTQQTRPAI